MRKLGGMAGAVHVDTRLPYPLSKLPFPFHYNGGKKPARNPDGESSRKEECYRVHISPLHESVRRNPECGVYTCVRAGRRWRPASSPRTLNASRWLLGPGTWGKSRPGAREGFELPQPTSRAPPRRGGTPSPSDLEIRASVWFASAHVCQRRAGRPLGTGGKGGQKSLGPRHHWSPTLTKQKEAFSGTPSSRPLPRPWAQPSFEMKEFGGSGCALLLSSPPGPESPGPLMAAWRAPASCPERSGAR